MLEHEAGGDVAFGESITGRGEVADRLVAGLSELTHKQRVGGLAELVANSRNRLLKG